MIASVHCMEVTNICDMCAFHTSSTNFQQQNVTPTCTCACTYTHMQHTTSPC